MIRRLEHLSCEERLRELGLFSLEGNLTAAVSSFTQKGRWEVKLHLYYIIATVRQLFQTLQWQGTTLFYQYYYFYRGKTKQPLVIQLYWEHVYQALRVLFIPPLDMLVYSCNPMEAISSNPALLIKYSTLETTLFSHLTLFRRPCWK